MAKRAALLSLLATLAVSCDNGTAPHAPPGGAKVTLNGRTFTTTLVLTEKERRHGPQNFSSLSKGHAYLMAWPKEHAVKLESRDARSSFGVIFMDRGL